MRLYLTRHGHALESNEDPKRPLSPQGRSQITKLSIFMKNAGIHIDSIYHSGKLRAEQTASIIQDQLQAPQKPIPLQNLLPNDSIEIIVETIQHFDSDTLLVGHLPFMAELASFLMTAKHHANFIFQTGSTLCLESSNTKNWAAAWLVDPNMLP